MAGPARRPRGRVLITDPDDPGYRYPQPGERLWHEPSQRWATVTVLERGRVPHVDEVSVIVEDCEVRIVKLRSLREEETPRPAVSPLLGLPYTVDPSGSGYRVES